MHQAETLDRANVVAKAISSIRRFTMLPEVTLRIVEIVGDESSGAADLHRVVSTDPVLCLRILKVVNSAFYGLPQPLSSVERAIVLLGGNAIKNIALAASLGRLAAPSTAGAASSAKALWLHSLAVAAGARAIAEAARNVDADEAFLCGLLHDIGFMVELQNDASRLMRTLAGASSGNAELIALEDRAFGANHQDFGRGLCEQWQMPPRVAEVIGGHHLPQALEDDSAPLARVVQLADAVAAKANLGFAGHAAAPADTAAAAVGVEAEVLERLAQTLPETTANLQDILR